jgi:vancomycin resistance protein YoaR
MSLLPHKNDNINNMQKLRGKFNNLFNIIKNRRSLLLLAAPFILLFILASCVVLYNFYYWGKVYPGVTVAGVKIGGLTRQEAAKKLEEEHKIPESIILTSGDQEFEIPTSAIELFYEYDKTAQEAFNLYKSSNSPNEIFKGLTTARDKPNIALKFSLNQEAFAENISFIAGQTSTEPVFPEAKLVNNNVLIEKGRPGSELDRDKITRSMFENWKIANFQAVEVSIKSIDPTLTDEEAEILKSRGEYLKDKSISLTFEYSTYVYKGADIVGLLENEGFSLEKIEALISKLEKQVERPAQNAAFMFEDGRVQEFLPAKDGVVLNKEELVANLKSKLLELEEYEDKQVALAIPTINTPPKITTSEVNNLGIKELIGRGESWFAGSIPSRVHNVQLSASKFNGVLIEPGETLSFNDTVGDVSALTGYQQAYIIQGGRTVLGDGGGVCQVSTTLFRAALDAGLPIVERRAHSYRVAYYEQGSAPGLDATVYAPTTDLKIKNDTPSHILIQTITDTRNNHLVFEMYGTSDGRVSTVTKPVVTSVTAPPEDLYIDDPTLPEGTIKQIDWKAWGANVSFSYKVHRNGETIFDKQYVSNYRPWQAKFLRGVSPEAN